MRQQLHRSRASADPASRTSLAREGAGRRQEWGSRIHPKTRALAGHVLCGYLAGEATDRDTVENVDVAWVPLAHLTRLIPAARLCPPIPTASEAA